MNTPSPSAAAAAAPPARSGNTPRHAPVFAGVFACVITLNSWAETADSPSTGRMLCEPDAKGEWNCSSQPTELPRRREGAPIPPVEPSSVSTPPASGPAATAAPIPAADSTRSSAPAEPIALAEPPRRQRVRILSQPRTAWAIQLIATTSQEALERVAKRYDLFDRPAVRLASGNSVRYALVWDVYPTRAEADAALRALPAGLRSMKPWVREVGSLQDAMNAATRISPVRRPAAEAATSTPQ